MYEISYNKKKKQGRNGFFSFLSYSKRFFSCFFFCVWATATPLTLRLEQNYCVRSRLLLLFFEWILWLCRRLGKKKKEILENNLLFTLAWGNHFTGLKETSSQRCINDLVLLQRLCLNTFLVFVHTLFLKNLFVVNVFKDNGIIQS